MNDKTAGQTPCRTVAPKGAGRDATAPTPRGTAADTTPAHSPAGSRVIGGSVPSPVPAGTEREDRWIATIWPSYSVEHMRSEPTSMRLLASIMALADAELAAVVSSSPATPGCYICQPDNPDAAEEGCAECDRASDAYHAALASLATPSRDATDNGIDVPAPSPASPAETREGRAWEEGFEAGGRWTLIDEEWYEDSQSFEEDDLPPRPPKPSNPYAAASPAVSLPGEQPGGQENWRLDFVCCGRDDGSQVFADEAMARSVREHYLLKLFPGDHERQAVLTRTDEAPRPWVGGPTAAAPALPGERADGEDRT